MDDILELLNLDTEGDAQKVVEHLKTHMPSSCKIIADLLEAENSILIGYDMIIDSIMKLPVQYGEQFKKSMSNSILGYNPLESAKNGIEKLDYDITKLRNMLDPDGTCVLASSSSGNPKTIRMETLKEADKMNKEYIQTVLNMLNVFR